MNSEKEKLLNATYDKFMKVSINKLPGELLEEITAENIMAYGTAIDEKLLSIKDCRDLVERQLEQASGMKFKHERIPVSIRISPEEDSAIFVEELNLTIKSKEVTHRLFLRITTALEYSDNKWKVVHFHTSKPDDTKSDTDTWHIDEWKRKSEELQKLVDLKTADLVIKNRDLEIEASLERVRAVAMGMRNAKDLLDICETLFNELRKLGFDELRNTMINIHNDEKETFINYDYSDTLGKTITPLYYNINSVIAKQIKQIRKGKDAFSETSFAGDELKEWKKFRKRKGEPDDPRLKNTKALYYYFYSIGTGSIGISTFGSVSKEKLELLKRFRNVFEYAYRRYMDVMQAESQAREAKIEIALEKVRSRTMAMQKSEELSETTFVLFQQFMDLGEAPDQITIGIINNEGKVIEFWTTMEGNKVDQMIKFPIRETNLMRKLYAAWKNQKKSIAIEIKGKELHDYIDCRIRLTGVKTKSDHGYERRFIHSAFFSKGMITISTNDPRSKETIELLERFAGVFDLTYTRFLDLQKAEAQAKEAKIELALEKIRARSMAMHNSYELVDASIVLFNELKSLGIESIRTGIAIADESKKAVEIWSSQLIEEKRNKILGVVPFKSHPFFELYYKAWKRKEPYLLHEVEGKEVKKYYKVMSSVLSYPEKKEFNPKECFYTFFFPEGSLNVVSKNNLTDNECSLMIRFAKVFGMIYRRFLDLQNAEAQARESQIQLALERVRAKAMAMQKSDELLGVSLELYNQFKQLDSSVRGLTINIINEKERVFEVSFGMFNQSFKLSIDEKIVMNKAYKCWKSGKKSLVLELDRDEVIKFNKIRNKAVGSEIFPLKYKPGFKLILYIAFFSNGMLIVGMSESRPDETIDILQRFASVFDLSYTRFLDLKKAESQSREAQIELALERVRARTMAMQRSDELEETSQLLFQQFKELGEHPERITIGTIIEDERQIELWVTVEGDRNRMVKVSIDETDVFKKTYLAWKEQKKSILIDLTGKRLSEYLKYRSSFGNTHGKSDLPKDRIISYVAFFSKGLISITTPTLWSGENIQLLERFAGVFDLTYTRFLDLQKAEAQAKESQIELGLERVRARAMAMQKSGELSELVDTVFKELTKLDFALTWCIINIIDEKTMSNSVWAANPDIKKAPDNYYMKFEDYPFHHAMFKGWKERDTKFIYVIEGREKQIYDDYLFSETEFRKVPKAAQQASRAMKKYVSSFSFSNFGGLQTVGDEPLSEVNLDILERFGKVFDLTYTRFNDLLKAESQSREAQIEVALERVRSRTMAMHKSEELAETAAVLFQQLCVLGIDALRLYIGIIEEECDEIEFWTTDYGGSQISSKYKANLYGSTTFKNIYTGWKEKQKSIVVDPKGKELTEHLYYLKEIMGYPIRDRKTLSRRLQTIAYFSKGLIGVLSNDELPKESINLLERFAGVFDLTYRRFLDLQTSEAQTREAQIEVALERVRSRTMAMHSSDELQEASVLLFQQIRELGVDTGSCGYVIWENKNKEATVRMSSAEGGIQDPFNLPHTKSKIYKEIFSAKESGKDFFVKEVRGAELKKHFDFLTTVPGIGEKIKQLRKARYKFPETIVYNCAFFKQGYLSFHTHEQNPDAHDIFRRFANVFEQTYTRFLDLKKAEAQAKEAQIEASLEKVRSRSLAMHSADELGEVITVVVEKLRDLDFSVDDGVALITHIEGSKDLLEWMVNPGFPSAIKFYLPYFEHPVLSNLWKAKNDGAEFVAARYTAKENKSFLNHIFKHSDFKHTPQPIKDYCLAANTYATSIAFQKHTAIFINDYSGKTLTEQEIDILKRFSKVFEQAYIRFLDLQKAEGQVKEAQIEAALERVRSRTMGMQKSEELKDVIQVIYEQFVHLNINIDHAGIIMDYKERDDMNIWVSDHRGNLSQVIIPYFDSEHWNRFNEAKEKGLDFFPVNLNFKEKNRFYKKLFKYIPGIPEEAKDFYFGCPGLAISTVLLDNVSLYIENFSGISYSEEDNATLMRFGKVFQQTYTRFLDLQKAEAQAREAMIEAGLERVRSRAMAMHKTDELLDASELVYKELSALGITSMNVSYCFIDETEKFASYYSVNPVDGKTLPFPFVFPHTETKVMRSILSGWKKQVPFTVIELDEEATVKHQTFAGEHIQKIITKNKIDIPFSLESFLAISPKTAVIYTFNFTKGYLFVIGEELLTKTQEELLLRFTKVFEQAYIRFLDLQKAEAQAREAQIELGLERVRARAMAMQNSKELEELIGTVFTELTKLDLALTRCIIWVFEPATNAARWWMANSEEPSNPMSFFIKYHEHPAYLSFVKEWKRQNVKFVYDLNGEDKIAWDDILFNETELKLLPDAVKDGMRAPERVLLSGSFNNFGGINAASLEPLSDEHFDILLRFAKVFDLTYTRFNDLQKAEAQAREAKIETSLERVRSKTMAMHNSPEVGETVAVMFDELRKLGIETYRCGIGILDETKEMEVWAAKPDDKGKAELIIGYLDMSMHPLLKGALDNWKNKKDSYYYHLKGKDLINYFNAINKHANYPAKYNFDSLPREIFHHDFYFKEGTLFVFTLNQITAEDESTFKRFAGVFGQTYRRYKDLQKAEAQAKEAQIEAALERTRTQSMLMQHSSELDISSRVFHEQLLLLGIGSEISFVWLPDVEKGKHLFWTTWVDTEKDSNELKSKSVTYDLDRTEPYTAECFRAWESGEPVHVYKVAPGEVKIYFDTWGELFADAKRFPEYFPKGLYYAEAFMKYGCFGFIISRQLTEDEKKILLRFTIEFERTYSRFLDLQKAEAQAREALIEAALERVRGKAMAMHNSVDLTDAAGIVFSELNNLGIHPIRTGFVLLSKDSRIAKLYPATSFDNKNTVSFTGEFEFTGHPVYEKQYEIWQNNENYFPVLEGDLLKSYYKILAKGLSVPYENFPTAKKQFGTFLPFSEGFLFTWSDEQYSDNEINILDRFKNILDLTIRRYIDLKNAEAQSRESQIEASLERVRSKAMAMQKSEDLALAVSTIFEELDKLDLGALRCGIGIIDKAKKSVDVWATAISDGRKTVQVSGDESMDTHPLLKGAFDAWLRQEDFSYLLQGADLKKYYEVQIESNFKLPESQSIQNDTEGLKQYYYVAVFQSGGLFAFRETPFPEEAITVIKRFADVINFTYTRFNDLKQAEAQAKEAKIEAALERVRAGSLIMRKPEDMFDVCKVISEQLKLLKVNEIRNTQTVILNEGKETYQNYEYFPDYNEKTFSEIDYNLHPKVTEFVNEIKKSSEAFFTTSFEGNELQEWREYRKNTNQIPDAKLDSAHSVHYYFYSIGPGALGISTYAPLSEEEISIFKRFRNVFELAYRRYIDIEQAEAQAREAQIEAALERVRSRTLAMQKSDELAETAAVVFKQLINLGIEPNRLYIGIINDDSGNIEAWATDEDGSKVSKEFTLNINANASVKKMYDGWAEKKKSIIIDMHGEVLESYLHYIGDVLHVPFKGGLSQDRRVQNIAYFSKGFIGMASPDPQPEETAVLLERFAAVFNLTFTRFNDLQIAEKHAEQAELDLIKLQTEKKRAEEALTELRSTQAQLIQSEKMASLGELTAGIAHEIQNPLNFVNNFSEVNSELVEELNHELANGNFDEAIAIAKDIKENEDKIKHHGKRAEGIVKGMLQHSRSSSGVKEPVNINALADEYLRLAYHGLRAKDKTFNAKMETDFDESIGKINVIPQEIGRVILNLITNAFYAVTEKKTEEIKGYEPTVTVGTKKSGDNILISVKDNGSGIPQKVMDKIFQPFFTTKPTGLGTGLGLSMSYDIIKAHGGELKVETKEGEGAEFIIVLPLAENK